MKYRYYGFGNFHLSQIQQGIQAAHTIADMSILYDRETKEFNTYLKWVDFHKTIILLNGGNQESLKDLILFFNSKDNKFPWTYFTEDTESLNNCITQVGIILPEYIYDYSRLTETGVTQYSGVNLEKLSDFEKELGLKLSTYRLA